MFRVAHRHSPINFPPRRSGATTVGGRDPGAAEDLPYRVELWDARKQSVATVLALSASAGVGYAAYFAATREYPQRMITLRSRGRMLSCWNAPGR